MSFKTSVLIWFSRSLWYSLTPSSSPTERGAPNGVGLLCETEEHGFRHNDKETYYLMTWALKTE